MLVLETLEKDLALGRNKSVVGLSALLHKSQELSQAAVKPAQAAAVAAVSTPKQVATAESKLQKQSPQKKSVDSSIPHQDDNHLARGVSGLPLDQTPALLGAKRAHIECDTDVDFLAYWNDPRGTRDVEFTSEFASPSTSRFLTFEPDPGGWNNVRMSLETIVVLAAATGRTLVLPPNMPFYLLGQGEEHARSFASFFSLPKELDIITMTDFLQLHGERVLGLSQEGIAPLLPVAEMCIFQPDSNRTCDSLNTILRSKGLQPEMEGNANCLIFNKEVFDGGSLTVEEQVGVNRFCGVRSSVMCVMLCISCGYASQFILSLSHYRLASQSFTVTTCTIRLSYIGRLPI